MIRAKVWKMWEYWMYFPCFILSGCEALLRWSSPEYGLVPPNRFIPIIENDPSFVKLGEWILRRAMEDTKPFLASCPAFELNVNIARGGKDVRLIGVMNELAGICGSRVCAEGVETQEQCEIVHQCGVDTIQGYCFSNPVPVDAFRGQFVPVD